MALLQADRISISRKIIQIPVQNAQSDLIQSQFEQAKVEAQKEDSSNKNLMDSITPTVDGYQSEIQRYDGNGRSNLIEQDLIDSVNRKIQNPFFPNDTTITTIPGVPDGVWKNFPAFSATKAIGKNNIGSFLPIVTKEQDLIDTINTEIAIVEALIDATRSSGNECIPGLPGPVPPATPDTIQSSATMQAAATAMIAAVQAWEDFINITFNTIPTNILDPDPTRSAQNDISRSDITNTISIIDTWQILQDFDTTTSTPTTCAAFDVFAASNFNPSKFRVTELQPLKDEITARQAFIPIRTGEVNTNLGSITQDLNNGEILSTAGFYGSRFRIIDMRLNTMGGSLGKLSNIERGQDAQEEAKKSNDNAATVYASIMTASLFTAPSGGNDNIHIQDSSGFSVSDTVYVVAENQQEIQTTIIAIDGNRVVLANKIPKKYRETDLARLYKEL